VDLSLDLWTSGQLYYGWTRFHPAAYLSGAFFAAKALHGQIWRTPLLSMFLLTFFGTLFENGLYLVGLFVQGVGFSFSEAFTTILCPACSSTCF